MFSETLTFLIGVQRNFRAYHYLESPKANVFPNSGFSNGRTDWVDTVSITKPQIYKYEHRGTWVVNIENVAGGRHTRRLFFSGCRVFFYTLDNDDNLIINSNLVLLSLLSSRCKDHREAVTIANTETQEDSQMIKQNNEL